MAAPAIAKLKPDALAANRIGAVSIAHQRPARMAGICAAMACATQEKQRLSAQRIVPE